MSKKPIFQRIIDKVKINQVTKCWEWMGILTGGYGQIRMGGKPLYIHRIMYQIFYGSIPENTPCILHHCDNPKCCNPIHLYAGTMQENSIDREKRKRSNHPYGEKHHRAKLTAKQVIDIRASKETPSLLAKQFKVYKTTINDIKNRKTWKHI